MVSESLLWSFLSSLVFISVTSFFNNASAITTAAAVVMAEVSLRSFTLDRPLLFASPLQVLLRLHFLRYHWDRPAPIYKLMEASPPSETARAPTHCSKLLQRWSCATRTAASFHAPTLADTRFPRASHASTCLADVITNVSPNSLLTSLLASSADVIFWIWIWPLTFQVDCWLWLAVDRWPLTFPGWLFQSRFSLPSFSRRFHFCCLFLHIVSLNG